MARSSLAQAREKLERVAEQLEQTEEYLGEFLNGEAEGDQPERVIWLLGRMSAAQDTVDALVEDLKELEDDAPVDSIPLTRSN